MSQRRLKQINSFLVVYPMRALQSDELPFEYDHLGDWRHPVEQICIVRDQFLRGRPIRFLDHCSQLLVRDFAAGLSGSLVFERCDQRIFQLLSLATQHPDMDLQKFHAIAGDIYRQATQIAISSLTAKPDCLDLPLL